MNNLDALLTSMKNLPLDPRLGGIDDGVFAEISRRSQSRMSVGAMALVGAISLGAGIAGAVLPAQPVRAATVFPFGAPAALAPSMLLGTGE